MINLIEALAEEHPGWAAPPDDAAQHWTEGQIRQHYGGVVAAKLLAPSLPRLDQAKLVTQRCALSCKEAETQRESNVLCTSCRAAFHIL